MKDKKYDILILNVFKPTICRYQDNKSNIRFEGLIFYEWLYVSSTYTIF